MVKTASGEWKQFNHPPLLPQFTRVSKKQLYCIETPSGEVSTFESLFNMYYCFPRSIKSWINYFCLITGFHYEQPHWSSICRLWPFGWAVRHRSVSRISNPEIHAHSTSIGSLIPLPASNTRTSASIKITAQLAETRLAVLEKRGFSDVQSCYEQDNPSKRVCRRLTQADN